MTSSAQNPIVSAADSSTASQAAQWTDGERLRNRSVATLSVLVPAYNEQYLIEASLRRLSVLDESPCLKHIQVIVVDDCSKDATPQSIERFQRFLEKSNDFKKFSSDLAAPRKKLWKGRGHSHRTRTLFRGPSRDPRRGLGIPSPRLASDGGPFRCRGRGRRIRFAIHARRLQESALFPSRSGQQIANVSVRLGL